MKKRNLFIIALTFAIFMPFSFLSAATLAERLSGKILLQVEDAGQAWYVEPGTGKRAFLGRPDDAFRIMRELGLGISEANYNIFASKVPAKFSGKILLRVEAHGEAYYVSPGDLKMNYLGRPADAFAVMRNLGLGITDVDLNTIGIHEQYQERAQEQTKTQGQAGKNEVENKEETTNEETGQTSLGKACEFTATYYRTTDLSSKLLIRTEEGIDHDWGAGNPDGVYLSDKFSVRWTGNCEFAEGRYRFTGTFDDAVKATIDNTWIYNYWVSNSDGVSFETELDITGGTHYIKVDYYEYFGNAVAKLDWEKIE